MKARTLALVAGLLVLSACGNQPTANDTLLQPQVTDGQPDGDAHPYVGLVVMQDASGNFLKQCNGTLLDPTHFLTVGHCTYGAAHAEIWFDADVQSGIPGNGYPSKGQASGTPYTHPQYDPNAFFLHDLGMVVLDRPYDAPEYGQLPQLNVLADLAAQLGENRVTFTAVGYGVQAFYPIQAGWKNTESLVRRVAHPKMWRFFFGDAAVITSNNAHTGGTCFGDDGAPYFIGNSRVIGGLSSAANTITCAGSNLIYRVDTQDDLDWLKNEFKLEPQP